MIREVAAQFEHPVMLFSGGKDSILMSYLAWKAFYPGKIPFPLMYIDTGHNFPETLEYRDRWVDELGVSLIVRTMEQSIRAGRAKERFFSFRGRFGQWDPKNQRPELWNIFSGLHRPGEHIRAFPISNWTALDVWQYLERDGVILAVGPRNQPIDGERVELLKIPFRTIGDMICTGAAVSGAQKSEDIVNEVAATRVTERGGRADDRRSEAAMEDREKQGYF